MVEPAQIAELRRLVNEPTDSGVYTDTLLGARIDAANGDVRTVAGAIWTEKAAGYAELVDVQEGSSRRALGDLHEQALKMAATYTPVDTEPGTIKRRVGTRKIVRP